MEPHLPTAARLRTWVLLGGLALAAACAREAAPAATADAPAPAANALPAASAPPAEPAQAPSDGAAIEVRGEFPGLRLEALSALPSPGEAALPSEADSSDCGASALSQEGGLADKAGWTVFAEEEWNGYRVVGISHPAVMLAGIGCTYPGGRVLFFRDGRPVAQVFDPNADTSEADSGLQGLWNPSKDKAPAMEGAAEELRVGGLHSSRARVLARGQALELAALPELDRYCGGQAQVPRIEGLDLSKARARLFAQGWRGDPPQREEGVENFLGGMIQAFPEVEDCAGTGMGFCRFAYRNPAGHGLALITAGEYQAAEGDQRGYEPSAVGYDVSCAAGGPG
ncbi:hypothetical protein K4L06_10310 [Lysobacter sp. BMK333-48F3]|uniref:hypothetical protein n=1 Tax=Lysobacter sp. BMK333-48F3 TaxID=2867962 RepID=UPI001C8C5FD9|nr:hypothetical protein [Lysobacter sp. BMK333-48F3]MBX9401705.1 hypothetical protein [Lysobacter sp. BMK333-48F3]